MTVRGLLVAVATALVVAVVASAAVLWAQGYRLYAVTSGSMLPTYAVGDLLVAAPPGGEYHVGDVVTFPSPAGAEHEVTTHRVSGVAGDLLETTGDANQTADLAPLPIDDVVGRIIGDVAKGGYVVVFLQQPLGVGAVMSSLVSMTLLWGLFFGPEPTPDPARRKDAVVVGPTPRHATSAA